jgi:hypothetical protein
MASHNELQALDLQRPRLFDHLIGAQQNRARHGETQRFGRLLAVVVSARNEGGLHQHDLVIVIDSDELAVQPFIQTARE